ncbi:thiopeptide-type bacteriocin biosynthesis protein [Micromonospora parva]|uniref:Protein-L-isoaspartate O-methyltransferase n=1 Tax=Micromonospora parva TaxID=1464048 RepID=A0ABW6VMV1_9ACTN
MAATGSLYRHVDAATIRIAAHSWRSGGLPWPHRGDAAGIDGWLREMWKRPGAAEAVWTASPEFASRVEAVCAGGTLDAGRGWRMALALARYLVRAQRRATPFGLFSGVAALRFDRAASVVPSGRWTIRVRPDAGWLASLIARLEADPHMRRNLRVQANNLAVGQGLRLAAERRPHASLPAEGVSSVRNTAAVRLAVSLATAPVSWTELVDRVTAAFPRTPRESVDALVADLVDHGVLISNLRPPSTCADPLRHILDQLDTVQDDHLNEQQPVAAALGSLHIDLGGIAAGMTHLLADLTNDDRICGVTEPIYRPEAYAFGGDQAMTVAHTLFHADSRHILGHLAAGGAHRRELGVVLATRLMRAAGLEFAEQGDVWRHLVIRRHQSDAPGPSLQLIAAVQRLLIAGDDAPGSPLAATPQWPQAQERAGADLGFLDRHGALTRDLRGVLTHHLLFLFNRLGISAADAWLLATAATHVAFQNSSTDAYDKHQLAQTTERSTHMVHSSDAEPEAPNAAMLREQLVTALKQRGHIRSASVEQAFRRVLREQFLPGVDVETVYTRRQIVTKRDPSGAALSSASSPSLVADMLEQLDPHPGHRVLEIGAATGINAALLAELTTPSGTVVTIELDQDLADGARTSLARAGYDTVDVIHADGALGHPDTAPYDRIIVTAGAWDISTAWWDQLAHQGRIVVPLRVHESGLTRCFAFDCTDTHQLTSTTTPLVCGFVALCRSRHNATYADLTVMPMGPPEKSRPAQEREAPGPSVLRRRVSRATRRRCQRRGIVGVR